MAIIILSEDTVKKIAAGEVIERPVSVVKELVENSIDAGSTSILIELKEGGKKLIRVVDNGCGMDRTDAQLAVQKHATSKLKNIDDLNTLTTLGFRGEALSSICAVAKVELCTKLNRKDVFEGTKVVVEGGKIKDTKPAPHPGGTTVTVKDLFYNLPARRKYLKSTRTELAHIVDWFTRQALIYNEISFKLLHENIELISTSSSKKWLNSIATIYGAELTKKLVPINYTNADIKINGFISPHTVSRSTPDNISVYINRRFVKSSALNNALKTAYGNLLPKDKYPVAIINIDIPPSKIDVNVHPTKRIVRFENEHDALENLIKAVQGSLRDAKLLPKVELKKPELAVPLPPPSIPPKPKPAVEVIAKPSLQRRIALETKKKLISVERKLPPLRIIGQLKDAFILAEYDEGLIVLDQHAVHERVIFEELKRKFTAGIEVQELLIPVNIELTEKERTIIEDNRDILAQYGFRIEHFGGRTYSVKAVPVAGAYIQDFNIIHDIIDNILTLGKKGAKIDLKDSIAEILACKTALKSGEKCTQQQLEQLVEALYKTENPFTCAHGRPTIIAITFKELERKFYRG